MPPAFALVELAVFFGVILALDRLVPGFDLGAVHPNPCWLPVLLLSLQYGTISGLLAAFAAIVLTMLTGLPEQDIGENHFAYLLRIWGEPMLWIAAALLLGQFRMRQIAEKQRLRVEVTELSSQRAAIAEYAANLRRRCDRLERQIAGESEPRLMAVMSALAEGGRGTAAGAAGAFPGLVTGVLGRAEAALYLAGDRGLTLAAATRGEAHRPRESYPRECALARAVLDEGRTVSVLEKGAERILDGEGLIAVPVAAHDGRILAMVRLDSVEPVLLGPGTAAALEVIGRQLLPALVTTPGLVAVRPAAKATEPAEPASLRSRLLKHVPWTKFAPARSDMAEAASGEQGDAARKAVG
jgi:hypothetical protein